MAKVKMTAAVTLQEQLCKENDSIWRLSHIVMFS